MNPKIAALMSSHLAPVSPAAQALPPPPPPEAPERPFIQTTPPPKRGGLPISVVAQVQKMYADLANQNNPKPNGQPAQLGLNPGWGGQGR